MSKPGSVGQLEAPVVSGTYRQPTQELEGPSPALNIRGSSLTLRSRVDVHPRTYMKPAWTGQSMMLASARTPIDACVSPTSSPISVKPRALKIMLPGEPRRKKHNAIQYNHCHQPTWSPTLEATTLPDPQLMKVTYFKRYNNQ